MDSVSEGKFYKEILHLTREISMNPISAILYGNRGEYLFILFSITYITGTFLYLIICILCFTACVYIKLRNPKAPFWDAVPALEVHLIYKFSMKFCFFFL